MIYNVTFSGIVNFDFFSAMASDDIFLERLLDDFEQEEFIIPDGFKELIDELFENCPYYFSRRELTLLVSCLTLIHTIENGNLDVA